MFERAKPLTQMEVDHISEQVAPGGRIVAAEQLEGGVSATITFLEYALPDGGLKRFILRQHGAFDLSGTPGRAMEEEALLRVLLQQRVPVPEPLLLETGFWTGGRSWLVCEYIEGDTVTAPPFPSDFAEQIAEALAGIHAVDSSLQELRFLEDGHYQACITVESCATSNFLPPAHRRYWQALETQLPDTPDEPQALLHGDFWPGNLIWKDGKLVGVIDWEDARLGDPLEDIANCHLELYLIGGAELADVFSKAYRRLRPGVDLKGIDFWNLYVAARLLRQIPNWEIDDAEKASMMPKVESRANEALSRFAGE